MEANNMAAMREALELVKTKLADWGFTTRHDAPPPGSLSYDCARLTETINAALAAPPRQCDIGTAEEQDDRWESFCASHHSPWKIIGGTGTMICDCPCYKGNNKCNRFAWAQTPYAEEGGAK